MREMLTMVFITALAPPVLGSNVLEWTTERVVVFKDGYSLFIKRGSAVTNDAGELVTEDVPDAPVLGSLWGVPSEGRLLGITAGTVSRTDTTTTVVACAAPVDVLEANKGKPCIVELGNDRRYRGTIGEVLGPDPGSRTPATHFVLETEEGDVLLPANQVERLIVEDMTTDCPVETATETHAKLLTFRFEEPNVERELRLIYFAPNLRWIPTYRLTLPASNDSTTAQLDLQAEVMNEAEDLVDVPLDLVVGVPNFRFKTVVSPLSLETTLRHTLQRAAPELASQQLMFSNAIVGPGGPNASDVRAREVNLPSDLATADAQDLFVYAHPPVRLKRGERAALSIFSAAVSVKHLYSWELHVRRSDGLPRQAFRGSPSPVVLTHNRVWHELVLTNDTLLPWTTGSLLMLQDARPLAQELLTYTSPGHSVRVPVTVAVDVQAKYDEHESGRSLEALRWNGYTYARIDESGRIQLTSYKGATIDMEITLRLGGIVDETSPHAVVTERSFEPGDWTHHGRSPELNPHSDVVWRLSLSPRASVELELAHHFFVRP